MDLGSDRPRGCRLVRDWGKIFGFFHSEPFGSIQQEIAKTDAEREPGVRLPLHPSHHELRVLLFKAYPAMVPIRIGLLFGIGTGRLLDPFRPGPYVGETFVFPAMYFRILLFGLLLGGLGLLSACQSVVGTWDDTEGYVSDRPADFVGLWKGSEADRIPAGPVVELELRTDGTASFTGSQDTQEGTWRVVGSFLFLEFGQQDGFVALKLLIADGAQLKFRYNSGNGRFGQHRFIMSRADEDQPVGTIAAGLVRPVDSNLRPEEYLGVWEGGLFRWRLSDDNSGSLESVMMGRALWEGTWLKVGDYLIVEDPLNGFCCARIIEKSEGQFQAFAQTGSIDIFNRL